LIVQGTEVTITVQDEEIDVTEGYNGLAPDIGAYEYGDDTYWIPGRQEAQASMAVPKNEGTDVPLDADLMYLIALEGVSANIYFGSNSETLVLIANQLDPYNIVALPEDSTLLSATTYYWRVDSILNNGETVDS
jgi:hypothetical protein